MDLELLGEARKEITGGLGPLSSLSIMYYFFSPLNLGCPKGSACENDSFAGEARNLQLAVSKPDYYDEFFFHEDLKKRF
jgi:hypothetical protein